MNTELIFICVNLCPSVMMISFILLKTQIFLMGVVQQVKIKRLQSKLWILQDREP